MFSLGRLLLVLSVATGMMACGQSSELQEIDAQVAELQAQAPLITDWGRRLNSRGAFSCDFTIDFTKTSEPIGATIERDRIIFQRFAREYTVPNNPGMLQKHIPILQQTPTTAFAGGRYLFEGRIQAAQYAEFVTQRAMYPGTTQFLDRPEFSDAECRDWTTLLAWEFSPVGDETAFRTERFDTGRSSLVDELLLTAQLLAASPKLVAAARSRGFSQLHVLHNLVDHKVQLVYFASRQSPPHPEAPDVAAYGYLASQSPMGDLLNLDLTAAFDRTTFVLNTWLPYAPGDSGEASRWPQSPPFPEPFCGDGVCVPSRGEVASCPADCTPNCGDGICQPEESMTTCPSDCEIPMVY